MFYLTINYEPYDNFWIVNLCKSTATLIISAKIENGIELASVYQLFKHMNRCFIGVYEVSTGRSVKGSKLN